MKFQIFLLFLIVNSIQGLVPQKDCKCKISARTRIIPGRLPKYKTNYPWLVSIQLKKLPGLQFESISGTSDVVHKHSCVATILNERCVNYL